MDKHLLAPMLAAIALVGSLLCATPARADLIDPELVVEYDDVLPEGDDFEDDGEQDFAEDDEDEDVLPDDDTDDDTEDEEQDPDEDDEKIVALDGPGMTREGPSVASLAMVGGGAVIVALAATYAIVRLRK